MSTTDDNRPEANQDAETETEAAEPAAATETETEREGAGVEPTLTTRERTAAERPKERQNGFARWAKRYGPVVVAAAVIATAVVVFGGDGGDGGDGSDGEAAILDQEELIRSGPMTPQKAELLGEEVDFGPNCDTETGRIKLPTVYAPPCVEPFDGDNGGATTPGVTADEILIVRYETDPALDPLGASIVGGAGADVNPETTRLAIDNYLALYQELFETYDRTIRLEHYTGTGAPDDAAAAKADAIAIAEKHPFAVIGGPGQQSPVFSSELAARRIVCGPTCALAIPEDIVEENLPYLWQADPTPEQAGALTAEMVNKLAGPGRARLARDPTLQDQDRVYAVVHYDNQDGDFVASFEALRDSLADNGIELATDVEFILDLARAQEIARTIISRLQEAGVTTVVYTGDPLTPGPLTAAATQQDFYPEWILGFNVLADTTFFARLMDPDQWKNGFGISFPSARGGPSTADPVRIYEWAYGEEPPNNTVVVTEPPLRTLLNGIHLAGPNLTPETLRDGLFRYPPSGGGPTATQISRGDHGVWPEVDYGGSDDAGLIWWDPTLTGEDEIGNQGTGMYRYANGGQRYKLGDFPDSIEEAGLFDEGASVTIYEELPADDQPPDYPRPDLG